MLLCCFSTHAFHCISEKHRCISKLGLGLWIKKSRERYFKNLFKLFVWRIIVKPNSLRCKHLKKNKQKKITLNKINISWTCCGTCVHLDFTNAYSSASFHAVTDSSPTVWNTDFDKKTAEEFTASASNHPTGLRV